MAELLSLKGSGGGLYNGTGGNNYGVELANATFTAGNGGTTSIRSTSAAMAVLEAAEITMA